MTDLAAIKSRINIVELVQETVPLKRLGANYKAPCPFHQEKTPSFVVSEEKQIYHCFGCGKGGDIFSWVMEREGMDFREAVVLLAEKSGVKVETRGGGGVPTDRRAQLVAINTRAQTFFEQLLHRSPKAEHARAYLKKRAIDADMAREFGVGWSPAGYTELVQHLRGAKIADRDMIEIGLALKSERDGRMRDRFSDRLMFPIHDHQGKLIGFAGRDLSGRKDVSKYINTPETPLYNKRGVLYHFWRAKKMIRERDEVVVVEGYTDVMRVARTGNLNVVASCGTAFTEDHIRLIKRQTKRVIFAFDGDEAGFKAADRALTIALAHDLDTRIMDFPADEDPDTYLLAHPNGWPEKVAGAKSAMLFFFDAWRARLNLSTPEGRKKYAGELLAKIAILPDVVDRATYTHKLADELGVEERLLGEQLEKMRAAQVRTQHNFGTAGSTSSGAAEAKSSDRQTPSHTPNNAAEAGAALEMDVLVALLLFAPKTIPAEFSRWFGDVHYAQLAKMLEVWYSQASRTGTPEEYLAAQSLERDREHRVLALTLRAEELRSTLRTHEREQNWLHSVQRLQRRYWQHRLQELSALLNVAERSGDKEKVATIMHGIAEATGKLASFST